MRLKEKMKKWLPDANNNFKKSTNDSPREIHVFTKASDNIYYLKGVFKNSSDMVYRHLNIGRTDKYIYLVYLDGMAEKEVVENQIINPIMNGTKDIKYIEDINTDIIENNMISAANITEMKYMEDLIISLLSGNTLLFIDDLNYGIAAGSRGANLRSVGVTTTEQTVRGPQEGFVEDIGINITQIRRRIKDPNLVVKIIKVGERTHTDIGIIYLNGVANPQIPAEIEKRISKIKIDGIIGSAQLEQLIEDRRFAVMPQIMATERPDKAAANILEGRVALIVDGSPFILVAPATLAILLNSPDDYYERTIIASIIRLIRYISFFSATTLPGAYLSFTAYHPGMLPTQLALSITGTRVGLPFPVYFEVLLMELTIDILQEAALRLPKPIGPTISIVGGIILGQAVVQAGIVSPIIVIIVSMTAVASFTLPSYALTQSTRVIRFLMIFAGSMLGLYGVVIAWINLIIYFASIESFGVRYLADFSPISFQGIKDTIIKLPQGLLKKRPVALSNLDDEGLGFEDNKE